MTSGTNPGEPGGESIWRRLDGAPVEPQRPQGLGPSPYGGGSAHAGHPGQVYVLASWWKRVGAQLIDGFVVGGIAYLLGIALAVGLGLTVSEAGGFLVGVEPLPESVSQTWPFYAILTGISLGPTVVFAILLTRWRGQTIGKRATGIRVVRADGVAMDFRTAVRREVLLKGLVLVIIASLTFGIGVLVNFLWPLWDAQNRAGHDFLARTRVVEAPADPGPG